MAKNANDIGRYFNEAKDKRSTSKELTIHEQQDFEATLAIKLAEEKGFWIDDINLVGVPFSSGHENNNYLDFENKVVFKANNLANCKTISALFSCVYIHNKLFPETEYEFVGFTGDKNRLTSIQPVFKQRLVDYSELANEQDIKTYMESLGFEQRTPESYYNGKYLVYDLYPRNVLKDKNGVIYVVDAEFKEVSE